MCFFNCRITGTMFLLQNKNFTHGSRYFRNHHDITSRKIDKNLPLAYIELSYSHPMKLNNY